MTASDTSPKDGQLSGLTAALARANGIVRSAYVPHNAPDAVAQLAAALADTPMAAILLHVTPFADVPAIIARAADLFPGTPVVGCTTAGEITGQGYSEGEIVAIGLPKTHFDARVLPIENLDVFDAPALIQQMIRNRREMERDNPNWHSEFTYLQIDGLSLKEDALASALGVGLGPVPLFGGSAGDGMDFDNTFVLYDGKAHQNAAVLTQIRTRCPIKVFKTDHLVPTDQRMVVTQANPARRLVHEINAEPAALEYARLLGKDPQQLTTFTFAAHPVVVRVGGQHHVRAIQRVAENGDLVFFSAIDEGLVLTLAEPMNMLRHLETELGALGATRKPDVVIACDCLLRRIEAQEKQLTGALSDTFAGHRVVGFSTYGEQFNSMHVNHTLTGVAIYPPQEDECPIPS